MDKFRRTFEKFERALKRFRELISSFDSALFPDDVKTELITKRFEYTYESMWKCLREYLKIQGIEVNSPLKTFGESVKEGIIRPEYEPHLGRMIEIRNILIHNYDEKKAKELSDELINNRFVEVFESVYESLKNKIS